MAAQERKPKPRKARSATPVEEAPAEKRPDAQALKDELDALLDDIDEVLEENAADFVDQYVQKGGE